MLVVRCNIRFARNQCIYLLFIFCLDINFWCVLNDLRDIGKFPTLIVRQRSVIKSMLRCTFLITLP